MKDYLEFKMKYGNRNIMFTDTVGKYEVSSIFFHRCRRVYDELDTFFECSVIKLGEGHKHKNIVWQNFYKSPKCLALAHQKVLEDIYNMTFVEDENK
jgi:hypothetical protein